MLGIRLSDEEERRLERHARDLGRPKSVIARDWIMDRLDREEIDDQVRRAAELHGAAMTVSDRSSAGVASDAYSRWLDSEDGGYDWGPDGPPPVR